jgi:hypothetical protein
MKISKTHQRFSDRLKEPRALTNPEDYLGPNWKTVLNFWLYVDGLSEYDKKVINYSYWALDVDLRGSALITVRDAPDKVVGDGIGFSAWCAVYNVTNLSYVFAYATYELIAKHKLLEQGKSLVFLPLCLKS